MDSIENSSRAADACSVESFGSVTRSRMLNRAGCVSKFALLCCVTVSTAQLLMFASTAGTTYVKGNSTLDLKRLLNHIQDINVYRAVYQTSCDRILPKYSASLVSYGGSGSTESYAFYRNKFGLVLNDHTDTDGLKHMSCPALFSKLTTCNSSTQMIIYQFGDPVNALYSLFRRQYSLSQVRKLGGSHSAAHCSDETVFTNITSYASLHRDVIGFGQHMESYLNCAAQLEVPVVFVKAETKCERKVVALLAQLMQYYKISFVLNKLYTCLQHRMTEELQVRYSQDESYDTLRSTYTGLRNLQSDLGRLTVAFKGRVEYIL